MAMPIYVDPLFDLFGIIIRCCRMILILYNWEEALKFMTAILIITQFAARQKKYTIEKIGDIDTWLGI